MTTSYGISASKIHKIKTLFNKRVPMRDGVELATGIYMPAEGGPFPALLLRTPYDKMASHDIQLRTAIVHLVKTLNCLQQHKLYTMTPFAHLISCYLSSQTQSL